MEKSKIGLRLVVDNTTEQQRKAEESARLNAKAWAIIESEQNPEMQRAIAEGRAVNLAGMPKNEQGDYILEHYTELPDRCLDYCDLNKGVWIWSIGRNKHTGQILASTTQKFYSNFEYDCIWLK